MSTVTIKARKFNFPNFMLLEIPGHDDTVSMDVGAAFPSDESAGEYWDELRNLWIDHVKARRAGMGKGSAP